MTSEFLWLSFSYSVFESSPGDSTMPWSLSQPRTAFSNFHEISIPWRFVNMQLLIQWDWGGGRRLCISNNFPHGDGSCSHETWESLIWEQIRDQCSLVYSNTSLKWQEPRELKKKKKKNYILSLGPITSEFNLIALGGVQNWQVLKAPQVVVILNPRWRTPAVLGTSSASCGING